MRVSLRRGRYDDQLEVVEKLREAAKRIEEEIEEFWIEDQDKTRNKYLSAIEPCLKVTSLSAGCDGISCNAVFGFAI